MHKLHAVLQSLTITLIVFALAASPSFVCTAPAPERATIMAAYGSVHVNVTDEAGRPIMGANVTIEFNASFYNHTDTNGSLIITGVGVGSHMFNASMLGYLNGSTTADVVANEVVNITIVVEGGEFTGRVYTQDVKPIANATVEIAIGTTILQNLTALDGSFSIKGIPTGSYIVVVFSQADTAVTEIATITAGSTTDRVQPFKLSRNTGWITGYVFDTGVPVPSATVSITIGSIEHSVLTDVVGHYEMPDVPAGNYTVRFSKEGYEDATIVNVTVANGIETGDVNVTLVGMPATISGSVTVITAGVAVLLYGATVEVLGTECHAVTSTSGLYEITDVPVGTWTIKASAPGYLDNETAGKVVGRGADITLNIVLTPKPGQLMGTVRAVNTFEALEGYRVAVSGPMQRETYTNDQGQYVFAGLTPGNYTLTVVPPATDSRFSPYIVYNVEIDPEAATTHDVSMTLIKQALGGFVFGLDLPHSFMVLALVLTLIVMVVAVYVRLKRFSAPAKGENPEGGEKKDLPPIQ